MQGSPRNSSVRAGLAFSLGMTTFSENLRVPIRLFQTAFSFVFKKFIEWSEDGSGSAGVDTNVEIDFVIEKMGVALPNHAKGAAIHVKIRGADDAIFDCKRHVCFSRDPITHARHDLVENVRKRAKERDGKDIAIAHLYLALAVHRPRLASDSGPFVAANHQSHRRFVLEIEIGQFWKIDVIDRHSGAITLVVFRERNVRTGPHCAGKDRAV